jgi:hypothetical protein
MEKVSKWLLIFLSIILIISCSEPKKLESIKFSGGREQILSGEMAELDITIFDTLIFVHKFEFNFTLT